MSDAEPPTESGAAKIGDLARDLADDPTLTGRAACHRRTERMDAVLRRLGEAAFGDNSGWALIALGGYGRRDLAPRSDVDVMLASSRPIDPDRVQRLWYPLWDAGVRLGHSVRTVKQYADLIGGDLATATSGLSARHLAGDPQTTRRALEIAQQNWIAEGRQWMRVLAESVLERHDGAPDVAWALEPDVKAGRGGLRDIHAIGWGLDWYRLTDRTPPPVDIARITALEDLLLDIRVAMHRANGTTDHLVMQDQEAVAIELGTTSSVDLLMLISRTGRSVARISDGFWFDVAPPTSTQSIMTPAGWQLAAGRLGWLRPEVPDPASVVEAATVAARNGLRFERATLKRLAEVPPPATPWSDSLRSRFIELLGAGPGIADVIDALDGAGFWSTLVPEWTEVSSRPQRNSYHRFTVDRHLIETVINGSARLELTPRPDLLLLACLVHDLGKVGHGDHTAIGMDLAAGLGARIGLDVEDTATLRLLVEHHLLLAEVATRRDLEDPMTVDSVVARLGNDLHIDLLHSLTIADSLATGPAAWSSWKSSLIETLVERSHQALQGATPVRFERVALPEVVEVQRLVRRDGRPRWIISSNSITIVAVDRPGLFARLSGALSLSGAIVLEAAAQSADGLAIDRFVVDWDLGGEQWNRVATNLELALTSRLALTARLAERSRSYRSPRTSPAMFEPEVRILTTDSEHHTVIEASGPDSVGLLSRLARAMAELALDIRQARVTTMGLDAVDSFYVQQNGAQVDMELHAEIRRALLHALVPPS